LLEEASLRVLVENFFGIHYLQYISTGRLLEAVIRTW